MHPTLLHFGHLAIPTFGALAACGLMLALTLSQSTAPLAKLDPDTLWDAGLFAILAAFVLSRLLLIAANLRTFLAYPLLLLAAPSLTATGLLLTAIATLLWLRLKRIPLLAALDAWAPCATLAWAFLSLGHFAEASDPGMPTTMPWGVRMPGDATPQHPVALYAALLALTLTGTLFFLLRRTHRKGASMSIALIAAGIAQFLLSFLRDPTVQTIAGLDALQFAAAGMTVAGCTLWISIQSPTQSLSS